MNYLLNKMDEITNEWFDKSAKGECHWICPDCCLNFNEGMPDECEYNHEKCSVWLKNQKN